MYRKFDSAESNIPPSFSTSIDANVMLDSITSSKRFMTKRQQSCELQQANKTTQLEMNTSKFQYKSSVQQDTNPGNENTSAEEEPEGNGDNTDPQYETLDGYSTKPMWKSYLYQVQNRAPMPHEVTFKEQIEEKPSYYGKEYHGAISRHDAEQLVMKCEGSYLTRESQSQAGSYALTFRFNNAPKNYKLYYDHEESQHYVGEKRFDSVFDLVADGLITMYVDLNAKDYIDTMTLGPSRNKKRMQILNDDGSNLLSQPIAESNNNIEEVRSLSIGSAKKRATFRASECRKEHNFKTNTYYGPHWCELCRNFMWGLKNQGVKCQDCSYDCHKQCTEEVPANCRPDKKLVQKVFGVDLTTLIKVHDWRRPIVVDSCIEEIEKRGLSIEGIYRIPGFNDDIQYYKDQIDKDGVVPDLSRSVLEDMNVVCGLLKLYFRMLPIPMLPFELYDEFMAAAKISDREERIKSVHTTLGKLPAAHSETLKYLLRHLQRVTKYSDKNRMSSDNLAIVFGPTLIRAPDHLALQAVADIQFQKNLVQTLIEEQDVFFN